LCFKATNRFIKLSISVKLTVYSPVVTPANIQQFHFLPTHCIYVFCMDLRTISNYFPIQHYLSGLYCAVRTGYLNVIWVICFIWIWEQTSIISPYNINWLVFITETECVYCAVRTGYLNVIWLVCFIWIWEQTAIISLYSINWLVFITRRSVFTARYGLGI